MMGSIHTHTHTPMVDSSAADRWVQGQPVSPVKEEVSSRARLLRESGREPAGSRPEQHNALWLLGFVALHSPLTYMGVVSPPHPRPSPRASYQ